MGEFIKVARMADILPGERLHYDFAEESVIILNVGGTFYCIADVCSHDDGPLGDGEVVGYEITCPRHGARFDVRNGRVLCLPATSPIPSYTVKLVDGDVYVQAPD